MRYHSNRIVAIEKKEKTAKKKKTSVLPSNFYCIYSSDLQPYLNRKLFRVTVSGDQNIKKDGDRSKLTNHKMTKFPERSEVCLFSLQEALCFYLNIIGSFIKKFDILCSQQTCSLVHFSSFRSGSNNLTALSTLQICFTFIHGLSQWVEIITELVTSLLFWIVSGSNNFFLVLNWNCWGLKN